MKNPKKYLLIALVSFVAFFALPNSANAALVGKAFIVKEVGTLPESILVNDGLNDYILPLGITASAPYLSMHRLSTSDENRSVIIYLADGLSPQDGDRIDFADAKTLSVSGSPKKLSLDKYRITDNEMGYRDGYYFKILTVTNNGREYKLITDDIFCVGSRVRTLYIDKHYKATGSSSTAYNFEAPGRYESCEVKTNVPQKIYTTKIRLTNDAIRFSWLPSVGSETFETEFQQKRNGKWKTVKKYETWINVKLHKTTQKGVYRMRVRGVSGTNKGPWSSWKSINR